MSELEISQYNFETVLRVHSPSVGGNVKDDALVVLKEKKVRDVF